MVKLLADENFNNHIIRGVLRQNPNVDILRVQDVDLSGADDPIVLKWARSGVSRKVRLARPGRRLIRKRDPTPQL
ncbi:MAG: DUF5615 family PIN-like protein [Hormoscilla sp. GUM202]|nr:DUF5615 family PIN-like protein [Hormoscilla sp. GUM202]